MSMIMKNSLETAQDGLWRFSASPEWSHGEAQQTGLIDWVAAGNAETDHAVWRIQLMDASVDNAHKNDSEELDYLHALFQKLPFK